MYPRFIQHFIDIQLPTLGVPFNDDYEAPKLTRKMFTSLRKPGKDFSGKVTPLFDHMLIPAAENDNAAEDVPAAEDIPTQQSPQTAASSHEEAADTLSQTSSSSSEDQDFHISQRKPDTPSTTSAHSSQVRPEDIMSIQNLQTLCNTLLQRVEALEATTSAQGHQIQILKARLKKH